LWIGHRTRYLFSVKPLLAILTCHAFKEQQDACRDTWLKTWGKEIDYRFFIGDPKKRAKKDEVYLPVPDNYESLPLKLFYTMKWTLERDYTNLFKADDDTYVHIPRLLASGYQYHDYCGSARQLFYAAGGCGYWLSRRAMKILVAEPEQEWKNRKLEDSSVGYYLVMNQKAPLFDDQRYVHSNLHWRFPTPGNDMITTHKCDPAYMREVHARFL